MDLHKSCCYGGGIGFLGGGHTITRPTPTVRPRPRATPTSQPREGQPPRTRSRVAAIPPVESLTAQELLGELTTRGLSTSGTAAELQARLRRHYEAEARRQEGATGFEEQIGALEARLPRTASQASAEPSRTASRSTDTAHNFLVSSRYRSVLHVFHG